MTRHTHHRNIATPHLVQAEVHSKYSGKERKLHEKSQKEEM
jgi:hypothetical protein